MAQWLLDNQPGCVNLRDLTKLTPGFPITDPEALDEAATLLVYAGFWRPIAATKIGRPRKDYEVSPLVRLAKTPKSPKRSDGDGFGPFGPFGDDVERDAIIAVDGGTE